MKKFLTVLLVIAVMFTFSFGTAFATLPSETDQAGLESAKTAAIAELNAYPNYANYDADGVNAVKNIIYTATEAIKADTTVNDVHAELAAAKASIDNVPVLALGDAKVAAKAQFTDYAYQYTLLGVLTDAAVSDAKVGYSRWDHATLGLYQAALAAMDGATSLEDVASALDTFLAKVDTVILNLSNETLTDDVRDALVKAIRLEADTHTVKATAGYSDTVIAKYEAAITEGVAAAKAVKTWDEYVKVANKYLGDARTTGAYLNPTVNASALNGVYIIYSQDSVFDTLAAMTKLTEAKIKVVKKALEALGDYNYANIALGTPADANWSDAELFFYQARYFVENGAFDTSVVAPVGSRTETLITYVTYNLNDPTLTDTVAEVYAVAENIVNLYNQMTILEAYKATELTSLDAYFGTTIASVNSGDAVVADYDAAAKNLIAAYKADAKAKITVATTTDSVDDIVEATMDKIDAVKTEAEKAFAEDVVEFNKALDDYVEAAISAKDLSADEKLFVERFVKDVKAKFLDDEALIAGTTLDAVKAAKAFATGQDVQSAFGSSAFTYQNGHGALYGYNPSYVSDYVGGTITKEVNKATVKAYVDAFAAALGTADVKTWATFFSEYDKTMANIDKVYTDTQQDYVDAIAAAEAKIAAIPATPELTYAYKKALDEATSKIGTYETKKAAFDALSADERAEVTAKLDTTAYDTAYYAYQRLVYESKDKGVSAVPEVNDFTAIANSFLTAPVNGAFDAAAKAEIAQIVTDTYAAIEAATTDAAKAAAAVAGIEKLDALATDTAIADETRAELLATVKANAARYFQKYENVTFTSDANGAYALAQDIAKFNKQFAGANKLTAEEAKAYLQDLSIKARSVKTSKGVKVTLVADVAPLLEAGYGVEYKFYRSEYSNKAFGTAKVVKTENTYLNTSGKKGTRYYYKAMIVVKDAKGVVVATSPLKQCLYATRVF